MNVGNINVKEWEFDTKLTRTSSKRSSYIEPVIQYVDSYLKEDITNIKSSKVKDGLEISSSSYNEMVKTDSFKESLEEAKRGLCYFRLV